MNNKIKQRRIECGIKRREFADRLNVSLRTVISAENCKRTPSLKLALKMARLLDTTIEELFELDKEFAQETEELTNR